jgi:antitoxin component YwqK of YwqJK toxin-antitoxin module
MRPIGFLLLILVLSPLGAQNDSRDWEPFYQEGELVEELLSDDNGRPLKNRFYHEGELLELREYLYEGNRVHVDVTHYRGGSISGTWREELYLNEDGSIRMLENGIEEEAHWAGWSSRAEWTRKGETQYIVSYSPSGEVLEKVTYRGEEKEKSESFTYDEEGRLESLNSINIKNKERHVFIYNQQGLTEELRFYRNALLVTQTFYSYNDQGLLVREESRGDGVLTESTFEYDSEKSLQVEQIYQNGQLSRKLYYRGDERTEEIYSKGQITLRIKYKGTEIIGEEKLQ